MQTDTEQEFQVQKLTKEKVTQASRESCCHQGGGKAPAP